MKVLVLGSGGREYSLCWKIRQSPLLKKLYTLPKNTSFSNISENIDIDILDFDSILSFVDKNSIDIVIVGPELPLAKGIADKLRVSGKMVFGPGLKGSVLESSKQVAKEFMFRNYIPTANFHIFYDFDYAVEYIKRTDKYPIVIKADGLCSGKGVVVCSTYEEAYNTLDSFMNKHIFGSSGMKVVIEEYLEGKEASVLCFVDSKRYLMLPVSRDYKRLFDGNLGPNTGGMGAIAPIDLDEKTLKEIEEDIVWRFMEAIIRERIDYKGVIYFGLMLTEDGPKVLEFNVRFGDPETQAIIPLIDDDLLEIIFEVASGNIRRSQIKVKKLKSMCVVISCDSYPTSTSKDVEIFGINDIDNDVIIFHAGTKFENGKYYTNGGRILNIVGLDYSFEKAREKVYRNISKIKFDGMYYRKDIGS